MIHPFLLTNNFSNIFFALIFNVGIFGKRLYKKGIKIIVMCCCIRMERRFHNSWLGGFIVHLLLFLNLKWECDFILNRQHNCEQETARKATKYSKLSFYIASLVFYIHLTAFNSMVLFLPQL